MLVLWGSYCQSKWRLLSLSINWSWGSLCLSSSMVWRLPDRKVCWVCLLVQLKQRWNTRNAELVNNTTQHNRTHCNTTQCSATECNTTDTSQQNLPQHNKTGNTEKPRTYAKQTSRGNIDLDQKLHRKKKGKNAAGITVKLALKCCTGFRSHLSSWKLFQKFQLSFISSSALRMLGFDTSPPPPTHTPREFQMAMHGVGIKKHRDPNKLWEFQNYLGTYGKTERFLVTWNTSRNIQKQGWLRLISRITNGSLRKFLR